MPKIVTLEPEILQFWQIVRSCEEQSANPVCIYHLICCSNPLPLCVCVCVCRLPVIDWGEPAWQNITVNSTERSVQFTGLLPMRTYQYRFVVVVNGTEYSPTLTQMVVMAAAGRSYHHCTNV